MAILLDRDSRILVQGASGAYGSAQLRGMREARAECGDDGDGDKNRAS